MLALQGALPKRSSCFTRPSWGGDVAAVAVAAVAEVCARRVVVVVVVVVLRNSWGVVEMITNDTKNIVNNLNDKVRSLLFLCPVPA